MAKKAQTAKEKNRKTLRRTTSSFIFGGVSLLMFFPYEQITWNFSLFVMAFIGVAAAALNLIGINRQHGAAGKKVNELQKGNHTMARVAWWLTFIPFIVVLVGLIFTGIFACSLYAG